MRRVISALSLAGALALHLAFSFKILPTFALMFRDFGGELPLITRVAISPVWTWGWTAWLLVGGGLGVWRIAGGRRPALLLAVLSSMTLIWIVSIFAMYVPIFTLAGQIRAE